MNSRYLGALILLPFLVLILLGGKSLIIAILLISLLGMYEFYNASKNININCFTIIGYVMCCIYYLILAYKLKIEITVFFILLSILIQFCIVIINNKYNFIDISVTLFGFFYIAISFSFIPMVSGKLYGNYLVWLIFISAFATDTFAYYAGSIWGRVKLSPIISPKKTVEGSIGGLIGSTILCGAYGIILKRFSINIPLINYFSIGLLCGILCQIGDLSASSIKRYCGIKDYSKLIPGHGGILDRFDSILFASIVVYYYITLVLGI